MHLEIRSPLARTAAAVVALVAWAALALRTNLTILEFTSAGDTVADGLWHLASYFTIWTNVLVASAMTAVALNRWPGGARASDGALAAAALYIAVVGVVNHALLRGLIDFTPEERIADVLLHYVVPGLTISHWMAFAPKKRLVLCHAVYWLAYPLAYCAYALLRGAETGRYPYPFLNVAKLGLESVLTNAALLGLAIFGVGVLVVITARQLRGAEGS